MIYVIKYDSCLFSCLNNVSGIHSHIVCLVFWLYNTSSGVLSLKGPLYESFLGAPFLEVLFI